ncbi:energy transducer TonB [Pontibacter qinzhouensis]|uniref:Energy transducer TonB n=1 Tax=Pontibacter qinzhouensis TaxID=2603253 RepID=A0A5C8KB79_9BACT|nr:energy transducer TonB [Pontibacter qinzhouensis]TXK52635.1 energy transducer TonB [Pontibacter qinzhouensis]
MNPTHFTTAVSLDDIVFDGRNKAYGAYLLRRLYNQHITKAAISASALFLLLVSMPLISQLIAGDTSTVLVNVPDGRIIPIDIIPPPPPPITEVIPPTPPPPQAQPAIRAQLKFTTPVIKPTNEVTTDEDLPEVDELRTIDAGTRTVEGVAGGIPDVGIPDGLGTATELTDVVEQPLIFADQMPAFPGGDAAMFTFISKNIKYPQQAIRAHIEGTVYVSFVVSRTGEISDIEVLRGLGAGCDEEAVRVIKSMPKWAPGKQNGRTVPVRYNIPIKYTLK